MDLEHAKKYDRGVTNATHEVRTVRKVPMRFLRIITYVQGTTNYMAVEIAKQKYMFAAKRRVASHHNPPLPKYNVLHDLESHWWVTAWARHDTPDGVNRHKTALNQMFPGDNNWGTRVGYMAMNEFADAVFDGTFPKEFTGALTA
jgi:hypothetical protein